MIYLLKKETIMTKEEFEYLKDFEDDECPICKKMSRKNNNFREFPDKFYE